MSTSLTDQMLTWTQNFTGVDLDANTSTSSDQTATGTSFPDISSATSTTPESSTSSVAQSIDTASDDYKQGYADGASGAASSAVPRAGQAESDYEAGYAQGQRDQAAQPAPSQPATPLPQADQSSDDYKQGYSDGSNGADSNIVPRADQAAVNYEAGYAAGRKVWESRPVDPNSSDPRVDPNSEPYRLGYQDGSTGNPSNPGPRAGGALASYNEGYAVGQNEWNEALEEAQKATEAGAKVAEHVVIHGVVHLAAEFAQISSGIWTFLVSMTLSMECDTRMWRYRCPVCKFEGPPQCTVEEAQADETAHLQDNPTHAPDPHLHEDDPSGSP
jgi:hypothetical protein